MTADEKIRLRKLALRKERPKQELDTSHISGISELFNNSPNFKQATEEKSFEVDPKFLEVDEIDI